MAWSHIQQRITAALQKKFRERAHSEFRRDEAKRERIAAAKAEGQRLYEKAVMHRFWVVRAKPPLVSASSKPILAGARSVFNLAGIMDEPIVGLIRPGVTTDDEALELLPFYEDQAERILGQAEEMMQASERRILRRKKT